MNLSYRIFLIALFSCLCISSSGAKLTGTIIGTEYSVDYSNSSQSTSVNTKANAFDGDYNTFFASYDRSGTWVGLDLGSPHVITSIGFSPRNDETYGPVRTILGVFEGSNTSDFSDSYPLYIIPSAGKLMQMNYADVQCSLGFRYVRYLGPNDTRCNISEIEFYGEKKDGSVAHISQLTELPLVVINTTDAADVVSKDYEINANVKIISGDGTSVLSAPAGIKGRGNASWAFPKKPYRIKFAEKQNVLDAPAKAKKWTLINNYGDKTLIRNCVAFEISRLMGMEYTPYCRLVNLVMNGEYKGTYQLCDQVEIGKNRIDIQEMEPEDASGDALTGGYFIEADGYADQEISWFTSDNAAIPITIKSPSDDEITSVQYNYIKDTFNAFEKKVFSSGFSNEVTGYRTLLDKDSFLRHFLIGELCGNSDTYWSTYMYKKRGDAKLYTGPVWDFDIAFDNDYRLYPTSRFSGFIYDCPDLMSAGGMVSLANRILEQDASSAMRLRFLWAQARNNGLSLINLYSYVDKLSEQIDASQKLNFKRWDILNTYVHHNPQIAGSYDGEIRVLKNYLSNRLALLDSKFGYTSVTNVSDSSRFIACVEGVITFNGFTDCDSSYTVHNLSGCLVAQGIVSNTSVLNLSQGIYIVRVNSQNSDGFTQKIIVP